MRKIIKLLSVGTLALAFVAQSHAITVTTYASQVALQNAIQSSLQGSSPGLTISSVAYNGALAASGTFSGGAAAGIGIESGVLMTSGFAQNVAGTANTSDAITGDNGLPGHAILEQLLPPVYNTLDATLVTINFTTTADTLYFNYVFGSDEYNEWVNSAYNDVFGFFLDGTAVADNVALIPSTTTPVAINNVNNLLNSAYYNDNDPTTVSPLKPFEYDGFTDVLQVSVSGLTAGSHTIILAIADAGDRVLDSGVFIQAGTFSDDPTPTPDGGATFGLLGLAMLGLGALRRKV